MKKKSSGVASDRTRCRDKVANAKDLAQTARIRAQVNPEGHAKQG